jgi:AraC-like DNA-binding protein
MTVIRRRGENFLANLAQQLEQAVARRMERGGAAEPAARLLAHGAGWTAEDVVCTAGPADRPFEEQHCDVAVALVVAGTFQYRAASGRGLMTPGSVLLGNSGQCFECGHEHGQGDRCVSFRFEAGYFESLASGAGVRNAGFAVPRLPPQAGFAALAARAAAGLLGAETPWEELAVQAAGRAVQAAAALPPGAGPSPAGAEARVSRAVRRIEAGLDERLDLRTLAGEARMSPFHFLRMFERVTGLTPHQYVMRARLRRAAQRLARRDGSAVLDIAYDCGFADVSNFNRAFRAEFGVSPRVFREGNGRPPLSSGARGNSSTLFHGAPNTGEKR